MKNSTHIYDIPNIETIYDELETSRRTINVYDDLKSFSSIKEKFIKFKNSIF